MTAQQPMSRETVLHTRTHARTRKKMTRRGRDWGRAPGLLLYLPRSTGQRAPVRLALRFVLPGLRSCHPVGSTTHPAVATPRAEQPDHPARRVDYTLKKKHERENERECECDHSRIQKSKK